MDSNKTTKRFPATAAVFRFVFSRRMVYTLLVATTVLAAAWQVENHRGRQRWAKVSAQIKITGDDLTWSPSLPLPVPAELNATHHPALAPAMVPADNAFGYNVQFSELRSLATAGIPDDLSSLDTTDPAAVLTATAPFGHYLAQLHQAFQRPHCYWFTYQPKPQDETYDHPVPNISSVTSIIEDFLDLAGLRIRAHLALADSSTATRELVSLINLIRSTSHDGSLVGTLVETAALDLTVPHLAGLITTPGWDDESLASVADALAGVRLVEKTDLALRRERAWSLHTTLTQDYLADLTYNHPIDYIYAAFAYVPRGWVYQNASNLATWWEDCVSPFYDRSTGRVDPGPHPDLRERLARPLTPYTIFVSVACPNIGNLYQHTAATQSSTNLLQLLCAIERHHLKHGQRPASLTQLVPEFITAIPLDPITNLPPHYATGKNGSLTLATLDWHRTHNPNTYSATINLSPKSPQVTNNQ